MPGKVCICLFVTTVFVWTLTGLSFTSDDNVWLYRQKDVKRGSRFPSVGGTNGEATETSGTKEGALRTHVKPLSHAWYPCGDGYCRCRGERADCSNAGLFYIPQLPSEVTALDFSHNSADDVTNNFLVNISSVTNLSLAYNSIRNISDMAFRHMAHLAHLDLSYNDLTCRALAVVFYIRTLATLKLHETTRCYDPTENICSTLSPYTGNPNGARDTFPNLTELDLGANDFQTMNMSCMSVFAGLRKLDLSSMTLKYSSLVETLHGFEHLIFLDMSAVRLSCDDLFGVLTTPSLETLVIRRYYYYCTVFCNRNITNTTVPKLKELNVGDSDFSTFFLTCLLPFTGLEKLVIDRIDYHRSQPVINGYVGLQLMKTLSYIDLSYNRLSCEALGTTLAVASLKELSVRAGTPCSVIYRFPKSSSVVTLDLSDNIIEKIQVNSEYEHAFGALECLDLTNNKLRILESPIIFPKLQKVLVKNNALSDLSIFAEANRSFPSLVEADFSNNALSHSFDQQQPLPSVPHLHSLNLDGNAIDFAYVNLNMLKGFPNLRALSVASNRMESVTEEQFVQLFGHLMHLKNMSLESTGLTYITAGMFQGLAALQNLDLSHNDMSALPDEVFKLLVHLAWVDLSSNKLSVITESVFPMATRQHLHYVDLRANPWLCSCDVLWFQSWLLSTPGLFVGRLSEYKCANMPDKTITSFFMQEQACLMSPLTSQFLIATVSLVLLGGSAFILLYNYRWHLRLVLYEAFRAPGDRLRRLQMQRFQYDVFVSYDKMDFLWVRHHLMPSLEGVMGLKLCIHQRDFIPGAAVVDNIMESVQSSKKMLMVFSRHFAKSQWCQFELNLCLTHAMDTDDVLIVVLLEDIPSRDLTSAMMAVMKTTTYIEWADGAAAQNSFWQRLRLSLDEILGGRGQAARN